MRRGRLRILPVAPSELMARFAPSELPAWLALSELLPYLLARLALVLVPAPSEIAHVHRVRPVTWQCLSLSEFAASACRVLSALQRLMDVAVEIIDATAQLLAVCWREREGLDWTATFDLLLVVLQGRGVEP